MKLNAFDIEMHSDVKIEETLSIDSIILTSSFGQTKAAKPNWFTN